MEMPRLASRGILFCGQGPDEKSGQEPVEATQAAICLLFRKYLRRADFALNLPPASGGKGSTH
jgi:hypothetical protein